MKRQITGVSCEGAGNEFTVCPECNALNNPDDSICFDCGARI